MHLEVIQVRGGGFTEVAAVHGDERLVFNVSTYGKVKLSDPSKVFDDINDYWQWMGPECQDLVWASYKEIKNFLDKSMDAFHIVKYIRRHLSTMYKAMPMESFSKWLLTKGNLYIPSDIKDTIGTDARYPRPDQTYLKEDYINLSALSLAIRPVLPIWGEYIDQGGQGNGDTLNKEMEAISLIAHTEIIAWPEDNSAFDKLLNYISIAASDTPVTLSTVWKGVSTEEIPMWFLSKVMVRRLTIVPLCDHSATHSIIANVYRYVKSLLKPSDRRTSDRVTEKRPDRDGRDEDDKTSIIESYKVKPRAPSGDIKLFGVGSENMAGLAQKVDPTFDLGLLEKTMAFLPDMHDKRLHAHQKTLAQWVLAKAFSPKAHRHVQHVDVIRLIVTAQALMWHWQFPDIACLMQVERAGGPDQGMPNISVRPSGSPRISRRYIEDLMRHYPNVKPQKARASELDPTNRNGNVAIIDINNLTKLIMAGNWTYYGSKELHKLAGQPDGRGMLVVPPVIKNRITELVIHIAGLNR